MLSEKQKILVSLLPLMLSLLFAGGMFFVGYMMTDQIREKRESKYKSQKLLDDINEILPSRDHGGRQNRQKNSNANAYYFLTFAIILAPMGFLAAGKALGLVGFSKDTMFLTKGIERNLVTAAVAICLLSISALTGYVGLLLLGFLP